MWWFIFAVYMGTMARLSGSGFGHKWGVAWLPEVLFAVPFGVAAGWAGDAFGVPFVQCQLITALGAVVSYLGMQSATWYFLKWEGHQDPATERTATLKPIVDFIARKLGYELGDEGYSWVAASVKGFIIGLPIGGILTALWWPLAYEIGSHAKGRVERFGIDPHAVSEILSGVFVVFAFLGFAEVVSIISGG